MNATNSTANSGNSQVSPKRHEKFLTKDSEDFKSIFTTLSSASPEQWLNEKQIFLIAKYKFESPAWNSLVQLGMQVGVNTELFTKKYHEKVLAKSLPTRRRSLADMLKTPPEKPVMIVDGLIAIGLNIIASAPKVGKTCIAQELALSVQTGTKAFDHFSTYQGHVLYLALEGGEYLFYERMLGLQGERDISKASMDIWFECPTRFPDLLNTIETYLICYPQTSLIVIDTYTYVREKPKSKDDIYNEDARLLGPIAQFATKKNIALLLVSHTNQNETYTDWVSTIQGSSGITATADILLLLKRSRTSTNGQLMVTGKAIPEMVVPMEFDYPRWIVEEEQIEKTVPKIVKCKEWFHNFLRSGPKKNDEIEDQAKLQGYTPRMIKDVKTIGVKDGLWKSEGPRNAITWTLTQLDLVVPDERFLRSDNQDLVHQTSNTYNTT